MVPGTPSESTPHPADFTIYVSQTLQSLSSRIVPATFVTGLEARKACGTGIRCLVGESSTSFLGRGPHLQAQVAEDL